MQKSDPAMPMAVIEEQASDVVTVVFQKALSADHARAMFASLRAWPEPLQGIAPDMLAARMMSHSTPQRRWPHGGPPPLCV